MDIGISGHRLVARASSRGIGQGRAFACPERAGDRTGWNFLVDGGAYISAF